MEKNKSSRKSKSNFKDTREMCMVNLFGELEIWKTVYEFSEGAPPSKVLYDNNEIDDYFSSKT